MTPLLNVQALSKRFGEHWAVDQIAFRINAGECLGVIGPNGAGKTTTVRMCLGQVAPSSGSIELSLPQGRTLRMPQDEQAIKAELGVVTQFDSLDPDFTCLENLHVYGRYFGLDRATLNERAPQLLEFAALSHKAASKPGELSGGMKRRLSLARALINRPRLLLLDEPTTGLDPQARHLMWERLQKLLQQGTSILLTTHFMDEAERLCNRLLVMDHGRIIAQGHPRDLIAQHLEPEVVEVYSVAANTSAKALLQASGPKWQAKLEQASARHANTEASSTSAAKGERIEISGETLFFYTHHAPTILQELQPFPQLQVLHRPVNLEDLFLKLTGRQIRESA